MSDLIVSMKPGKAEAKDGVISITPQYEVKAFDGGGVVSEPDSSNNGVNNRHQQPANNGGKTGIWVLAVILTAVAVGGLLGILWTRSVAMDAQAMADKGVTAAAEADKKAEKAIRIGNNAQATADAARAEVVSLEIRTANSLKDLEGKLGGRLDEVEKVQVRQEGALAQAFRDAKLADTKAEGAMTLLKGERKALNARLENIGNLNIGIADGKLKVGGSGGVKPATTANPDGTITVSIGLPPIKAANDSEE